VGWRAGWQAFHYLSFDVVIGSVLCYYVASRLPDGTNAPDPRTALVLGLAVWVIYTLDRLLDIRKPATSETARHAFHRTHQRVLTGAVAGAAVGAGVLAWGLPAAVWRMGLVLSTFTAAYLLLVSRLAARSVGQLWKEPLTALLFTAGIWGAALSPHAVVPWPDVVLALLFGVLVFQSLLLYSWFEAHDPRAQTVTLVSWLHPEPAAALAEGLALGVGTVVTIVSLIGVEHYQQRFLFILLGMTAVHGLLVRYRPFFQQNDRYRIVGELVFWLPGLLGG
jgi:hypothetical protein